MSGRTKTNKVQSAIKISLFIFVAMKNAFTQKWIDKYNRSFQRQLLEVESQIDFASNDYLGFAKNERVKKIFTQYAHILHLQGSTGSRLISGNRKWIQEIEHTIAQYHHAESCLIFPTAYQANVGVLSSIADRKDIYLIDENVHASIYDGIRLSFAKYFKFKHNDFSYLKNLIDKYYHLADNIFVVIEGLYSMDGDIVDVPQILNLIDNKKTFLIVDEAHSFGTIPHSPLGLFNEKKLSSHCAIRIIGYGKALGFSGAAVVGSTALIQYLINYSRAFIFSTALPFYHYQIILYLYDELINHSIYERNKLKENIEYYLLCSARNPAFSQNVSPIQYYSISSSHYTWIQQSLFNNNIFAKVILPPTVPKGKERVRLSLHSFNTKEEIAYLIDTLQQIEKKYDGS